MRKGEYLELLTSQKRIDILNILDRTQLPHTSGQFKDHLGVKSPAEIAKRLDELKDAGLINESIKSREGYRITSLGDVYVHYMTPFLEFIETLEKSSFWRDHDLTAIPEHLRYRLHELRNCTVQELYDEDLHNAYINFVDAVKSAKYVKGAAYSFIPEWINLFSDAVNNGILVEIITTDRVYEKIKNCYTAKLEEYLKNGGKLYLADVSISFLSTGDFTSLSLVSTTGKYDHRNKLYGRDSEAVKWTEDLYYWYFANAVEIKPINELYFPQSVAQLL